MKTMVTLVEPKGSEEFIIEFGFVKTTIDRGAATELIRELKRAVEELDAIEEEEEQIVTTKESTEFSWECPLCGKTNWIGNHPSNINRGASCKGCGKKVKISSATTW